MPRVNNAVASRQKRKKVMKQTKGYFGRRKNVWTVSKNAYEKGLSYAYRDRRNKKRNFRALWIQRINAAARQYGMSSSVSPPANLAETKAIGNPVAFDARALERDTRGFISITVNAPSAGLTAN